MKKIIILVFACLAVGCGGTTSSGGGAATSGLQFDSVADFSASASALSAWVAKAVTTAQCDDVEGSSDDDTPDLADGLDCDDDDGIVAHITPSRYLLAFKRVSLVPADEEDESIDLVPDTGTLGASEVVDFTPTANSTTVVTINASDLTAGTYSGIEAELYYFELTFPVGGTTRNVRIYMSDDDFDSEAATRSGLGPHHQGDITFINDAGTELGWIDSNWNDDLASERGDEQDGAGGTDAETDHDRGFFGDSEFWGQTVLNQGDGQDIFILSAEFDERLTIPDPSTITDLTTITATFSVADTFFYEDFGTQGDGFNPGPGEEASSGEAAWAPLAPEASLSVE